MRQRMTKLRHAGHVSRVECQGIPGRDVFAEPSSGAPPPANQSYGSARLAEELIQGIGIRGASDIVRGLQENTRFRPRRSSSRSPIARWLLLEPTRMGGHFQQSSRRLGFKNTAVYPEDVMGPAVLIVYISQRNRRGSGREASAGRAEDQTTV